MPENEPGVGDVVVWGGEAWMVWQLGDVVTLVRPIVGGGGQTTWKRVGVRGDEVQVLHAQPR